MTLIVKALLCKGKCIFLPVPWDPGENSHVKGFKAKGAVSGPWKGVQRQAGVHGI